jgi:hypothetical protein
MHSKGVVTNKGRFARGDRESAVDVHGRCRDKRRSVARGDLETAADVLGRCRDKQRAVAWHGRETAAGVRGRCGDKRRSVARGDRESAVDVHGRRRDEQRPVARGDQESAADVHGRRSDKPRSVARDEREGDGLGHISRPIFCARAHPHTHTCRRVPKTRTRTRSEKSSMSAASARCRRREIAELFRATGRSRGRSVGTFAAAVPSASVGRSSVTRSSSDEGEGVLSRFSAATPSQARAGRRVRPEKQPYGTRLAVVKRGRERGEGQATALDRDTKARARRWVRPAKQTRGPRLLIAIPRRERGDGSSHDSRSRRKGESGAPGSAADRGREARARWRRGVRPAKQPYGSRLSVATQRRE